MLAELIPLAKTVYARARSALRSSYRAPQPDGGGRFTVDTPVPYRFEDVIAAAESRMGKLENGDLAVQYQRLLMRINAARRNPRYAFIFDDGSEANDTMVDILCQLLRLKDDERPMAIVQLAGFPAETMEVIVSVLFRLAFEFGVWSDGCSSAADRLRGSAQLRQCRPHDRLPRRRARDCRASPRKAASTAFSLGWSPSVRISSIPR